VGLVGGWEIGGALGTDFPFALGTDHALRPQPNSRGRPEAYQQESTSASHPPPTPPYSSVGLVVGEAREWGRPRVGIIGGVGIILWVESKG
jgi:hypothetical protein